MRHLRPLTGLTHKFAIATNVYTTEIYDVISQSMLDSESHGGSDNNYNAKDLAVQKSSTVNGEDGDNLIAMLANNGELTFFEVNW